MPEATQDTIQVGRTVYRVTKKPEGSSRFKPAYELFGPRGAHYGLCRTVPKPHMMFVMNMRPGTFAVVERLGWFSDKDGTLRKVS